MAKQIEVEDVMVGTAKPAMAALPSFEIAERRAQNGDLDVLREAEVELLNQSEPMMTRWVFTGMGAPIGRFHSILRKGYQPVTVEEVIGQLQRQGFAASTEGYVTRGVKGEEILVKMPARLFEQIQHRKATDGDRKRRNATAMRQRMSDELASEGNHRGAEAMGRMQVTEFQETADTRKL